MKTRTNCTNVRTVVRMSSICWLLALAISLKPRTYTRARHHGLSKLVACSNPLAPARSRSTLDDRTLTRAPVSGQYQAVCVCVCEVSIPYRSTVNTTLKPLHRMRDPLYSPPQSQHALDHQRYMCVCMCVMLMPWRRARRSPLAAGLLVCRRHTCLFLRARVCVRPSMHRRAAHVVEITI